MSAASQYWWRHPSPQKHLCQNVYSRTVAAGKNRADHRATSRRGRSLRGAHMPGFGSRLLAILLISSLAASAAAAGTDWTTSGGGPASQRYSPLTQIRKENVARLTPLWTYHSGDLSRGDASHGGTA